MNHPVELILKNFRCFRAEQRGRLRPITLLVGENGTGKSSFLASYMAITKCFETYVIQSNPDYYTDFNLAPFELGSFGDILHTSASTKTKAAKFKLGVGLTYGESGSAQVDDLNVIFGEWDALPQIHYLRHKFDDSDFVEVKRMANGTKVSIPEFSTILESSIVDVCNLVKVIAFDVTHRQENEHRDISSWGGIGHSEQWRHAIENISNFLTSIIRRRYKRRPPAPPLDTFEFGSLRQSVDEIIPIAPIRSKPQRTYNPLRGQFGPEGEHIPLLLRRLSRSREHNWDAIRKGLIAFGRSAGLFSDIRIEDYGGGSNPFQIQFKVGSGAFVNIIDVGYGVSQSLPVVTNILASNAKARRTNPTFLLQQPEVHLHPRAQAELGNLVCNAYAEFRNRFMIETHSDYIVDRIRVMVRRGVVDASDVSIIYFEREPNGDSVKLFNIEVDGDGNILNAPSSYRDFFIAETDTVLGFRS